jgi:hypothetical protein
MKIAKVKLTIVILSASHSVILSGNAKDLCSLLSVNSAKNLDPSRCSG